MDIFNNLKKKISQNNKKINKLNINTSNKNLSNNNSFNFNFNNNGNNNGNGNGKLSISNITTPVKQVTGFVIPFFVKVIVIVLLVVLLVYLCYLIISDYYNISNNSPYLIDSITDATKPLIVPNSRIKESVDARYGLECSYSFWIYIKSSNYSYISNTNCNNIEENYKHILHKGNSDFASSGCDNKSDNKADKEGFKYPLLQFPGMWLNTKTNSIKFVVNTEENPYNNPNHPDNLELNNLPVDKWVHITFIIINNNIDVYLNCNLKKRHTLQYVPKYNYGDLFVTSFGGFLGYLSKLRYYNYALEPYDIINQCKMPPSSISEVSQDSQIEPPYLSDDYWFNTQYENDGFIKNYDKIRIKHKNTGLYLANNNLNDNKQDNKTILTNNKSNTLFTIENSNQNMRYNNGLFSFKSIINDKSYYLVGQGSGNGTVNMRDTTGTFYIKKSDNINDKSGIKYGEIVKIRYQAKNMTYCPDLDKHTNSCITAFTTTNGKKYICKYNHENNDMLDKDNFNKIYGNNIGINYNDLSNNYIENCSDKNKINGENKGIYLIRKDNYDDDDKTNKQVRTLYSDNNISVQDKNGDSDWIIERYY